jgi:uncharacterized Tic20 family protein
MDEPTPIPPTLTTTPTNEVAPHVPSKDEQSMGMLCHLSALAVFVIPAMGHVIGPLIVWMMKRETMPFVETEGKEALNFNLSVTIYAAISALLVCVGIGIFMLIALAVTHLILVILASIEAANGRSYRYPMTIRFIK